MTIARAGDALAALGDLRFSRRDALRWALGGAAALVAGHWGLDAFGAPQATSAAAVGKGKAKSVIQIWLWGGPSHLDTFDPKPGAGADYTGPLDHPIATNVKGIQICELLPLLAQQADKYSLIRSMTHGIDAHETAAYMVQTGRAPGGRIVFPCVGAVTALYKGYDAGYRGLIPPYIVLTEPQGRFSEAGFLGVRYKPFATGGDPARTPFAVEGIVAKDTTENRQKKRRELLDNLDSLRQAMPDDPQLKAAADAQNKAYDLILGDEGKVFDLSKETDGVRDQYGRNTFGQACLVARRLVERGIPYITINFKGWDTHKQHFQAMRRLLPELDKGLASLLSELSNRDLLGSTIVWCGGEFGRTPKVQYEAPWMGGRGHYGKVFSTLVAGGGFRGGAVVGESDATGEHVKSRPVYPCDLIDSMYTLLGIDPAANLPNPQGLATPVSPSAAEGAVKGGILKEIL